jgi:hypothetical protein
MAIPPEHHFPIICLAQKRAPAQAARSRSREAGHRG